MPLYAGHPAVSAGDEAAFGLVEDDQYVAEGIADASTAAKANVEGARDSLVSGFRQI
jgi:hypothetical protein